MKKTTRNVIQVLTVTAIFTLSTIASAVNLDLNFAVTGERFAVPTWQNSSSTVITSVTFNFNNYVGVAATNVDSDTTQVKVIDGMRSGAQSVALTRPATCTIGATSVAAAHVIFMDGGVEVATDTNVTFTIGTLKAIGLRFDDLGSYGATLGAVACTTAGKLTYTY